MSLLCVCVCVCVFLIKSYSYTVCQGRCDLCVGNVYRMLLTVSRQGFHTHLLCCVSESIIVLTWNYNQTSSSIHPINSPALAMRNSVIQRFPKSYLDLVVFAPVSICRVWGLGQGVLCRNGATVIVAPWEPRGFLSDLRGCAGLLEGCGRPTTAIVCLRRCPGYFYGHVWFAEKLEVPLRSIWEVFWDTWRLDVASTSLKRPPGGFWLAKKAEVPLGNVWEAFPQLGTLCLT